jgi:hypothetical protein
MAYGVSTIDGKETNFGFADVKDWFNSVILSFPAPWKIGDDTHYGTELFDARGKRLLSIWLVFGEPSARQKGGMTDEEWQEYCCDCQWESQTQWHIANAIVAARNSLTGQTHENEAALHLLRTLILEFGRWKEDINSEIVCGGPERRKTDDDPAILKAVASATATRH